MTPFERLSVWATSLLTFLTGVGYLWSKYFLHSDDPWSLVNHPLQPWFLKAHVLVAPLLVFAVGLIALRHVWRHLRTRTACGWHTGLVVVVVVGPMALTGYLIQVVTHVGWVRALAWAHIVLGFLYTLGLAAHQVAVRRDRRARVLANGLATPEVTEAGRASFDAEPAEPLFGTFSRPR